MINKGVKTFFENKFVRKVLRKTFLVVLLLFISSSTKFSLCTKDKSLIFIYRKMDKSENTSITYLPSMYLFY